MIYENLNLEPGPLYTLKKVPYLDIKKHNTNTFDKVKKTYVLAHEGHLRILKVTMTNNHCANIQLTFYLGNNYLALHSAGFSFQKF